jgi:Trk-type K+ transport system membrane component
MIGLIVLIVAAVGILAFRGYRLVHFYIEANSNPDEDERKLAHKNYIVHLVFFLLLLAIVVLLSYNLIYELKER